MSATGQALARAGLIVTVAFFISRVLGWIRLIVISSFFGASAELDAYLAAFRIPDALFQLVAAGALSAALVPVLSGLIGRGETDRAWRVVSTVANLMLLVLLGLSVVVAVFAPQIIPLITPGFDAVGNELTIRLSRIMLLSPILLALGALATAVLNTTGRFAASALAPLLYNLGIIAGALFLAPFIGVEALAIGTVAGSFAHLLVQLPALLRRTGLRYDLVVDLQDRAARTALLLMAPRAIGLGASQITFIVNTTLASGLGIGAIVAYNVAFTVLQIPIGVIGVPLGVVLLPSMSRAMAAGSLREFGRLVVRSLRLLLFVMLFLTAVGMVLRRQVVTLLFDYGRFDDRAIDLTANTLLFLLVGLAAHAMIAILARAFYAGQDTRTPVTAALVSVAVNIVVSVATVGSLGLSGLALGIAVGAWIESAILATLLWRRTSGVALDSVARALAEFGFGAFLAALGALAVVRLTEGLVGLDPAKIPTLVQASAATTVAVAIYVTYAWLLRVPELAGTVDLVRSAVRRRP